MALRSQLRPWGCPEPFPSCSIYLELRLPTHFTPTVPLSPQMPVQISDNALGRDDSSVCLSQNIHCKLSIHLPHRITLPPPVTHPLTSPPEDTALIFLKVNTAKPLPQLKIFHLLPSSHRRKHNHPGWPMHRSFLIWLPHPPPHLKPLPSTLGLNTLNYF